MRERHEISQGGRQFVIVGDVSKAHRRIRVRESTVVNAGDHDHDEGEAAEAEETWSLGGSAITVKSSSPARDWSSFGTFSATRARGLSNILRRLTLF